MVAMAITFPTESQTGPNGKCANSKINSKRYKCPKYPQTLKNGEFEKLKNLKKIDYEKIPKKLRFRPILTLGT